VKYFLPRLLLFCINANGKEQLGVYIQEKNTAKLQKNIFELVWKASA